MRKPKQVLVFLYRENHNNEYEYCIFYRTKMKIWQAISGGVEDDETLIETVKREIKEETNLDVDEIYQLSSTTTIPVINVTDEFAFGKNIYVVTEYCFGVHINNDEIKLSNEHKQYRWLNFKDAYNKLEFDSNKNALWELNERLLNSDLN